MRLGFFLSIFLLSVSPAYAYVGPGAGLGAIAAIVAVVVGLLLLAVGFIYFPVRRKLRARKAARSETHPDTEKA
ncbi:hypothetical protein OAM69_03195 [bacterium]|nr:hypothetical protein [bacterium]